MNRKEQQQEALGRAPLTTKYQASKIQDFAGLRAVKGILSKVAESPYQSAWLFVGPAGTGKTTMAYAFASAIGAQVHHIASKSCNLDSVEDVCHACAFVPMFGANSFHVVIVDEADLMSNAAQAAFLSKLDSTEFPPQTIFIFTCNTTQGLEPRFLSRCRCLTFDPPSASVLATALAFIWKREAVGRPEPNLERIVKDARGNFRDCLMRLELAIFSEDEQPEEPVPAVIAQASPVVEQKPEPPAYGSPAWWALQRGAA